MQFTKFGHTGLSVSRMILGTGPEIVAKRPSFGPLLDPRTKLAGIGCPALSSLQFRRSRISGNHHVKTLPRPH
jgi:hypothetical protein